MNSSGEVEIREGRAFVDKKATRRDYLDPRLNTWDRSIPDYRISQGSYYVLGDNENFQLGLVKCGVNGIASGLCSARIRISTTGMSSKRLQIAVDPARSSLQQLTTVIEKLNAIVRVQTETSKH